MGFTLRTAKIDVVPTRRATAHVQRPPKPMLLRGVRYVFLFALLSVPRSLEGQVVEYTDETTFLSALASQSLVPVQEGFEDDVAWAAARSPATASSVANLGITWTSNNAISQITTGLGPARTGSWGFFCLPHGDYNNGITDGWRGTGAQPLVAIGGWFDGTSGGRLNVILDGDELNAADFGGANAIVNAHQFFGVIDTGGFSTFEFRETEGTIGDQKFIFADDFTFAFGGVILDCNENGLADAFDIANLDSADCNGNLLPDECEIEVGTDAPGGPFYCMENCDPECNQNGILDACEVVTPQDFASGQLSPIGQGSPQSFVIVSPPVTKADAILSFTAYANLGGGPDHISVDINGVDVGTVFGADVNDCPELQPDWTQLIVPMTTFNAAVAGGDAVINMVASAEVDPFGCDPNTYVTVEARLFVSSEHDLNENGLLDECESVIPAVSTWGLIALTLLTLTAGTLVLRRKGMSPTR